MRHRRFPVRIRSRQKGAFHPDNEIEGCGEAYMKPRKPGEPDIDTANPGKDLAGQNERFVLV